MRIIAGTRKGHTIAAPKGLGTRPTGDRVREAAFNLIGPVDEAAVLDLFAGSGAMGLEALSRGARRCVFVESDRGACRAIEANLAKLRLTGALVLCQDALLALRQERTAHRSYELVLCDPPYDLWATLEPSLGEPLGAVLADGGLLLVETDSHTEPELPPFSKRTSRRYGSARISIFEHP